MKHLFTILLTLFSFYASGYAQKPFKVVFYNLENFFDLENDPDVLDDEFTPEGPKKWTQEKAACFLSCARTFMRFLEGSAICQNWSSTFLNQCRL